MSQHTVACQIHVVREVVTTVIETYIQLHMHTITILVLQAWSPFVDPNHTSVVLR